MSTKNKDESSVKTMIKIAPSILAADFSRLGEEITRAQRAGADFIHIDVMDGHFVPNITIGPPVIKSLRHVTPLIFDVHLMIENPGRYIDDFIDAGSDIVTVHVESSSDISSVIQQIKSRGKKAGVSLKPETPLSTLDMVLEEVDMVLVMTVNPGFGGQAYIGTMTQKVRDLKEKIADRKLKVDIEVDGGIDLTNIYEVTKAGANIIVAGTTIYKAADMGGIMAQFREKAYKL